MAYQGSRTWLDRAFDHSGLLFGSTHHASVAEVTGEVAALQPRLHCDKEACSIGPVDDAVIVRKREKDR